MFNERLRAINPLKKVINKIKNKSTRDYFLSITSMESVFYKLINLVWISLLVCVSGFLVRDHVLNLVAKTGSLNPFGGIYTLTLNNGIGLGNLSNAPVGVVYFVQSIPIVVGIVSFFFLNRSYLYIPLLFILFGGLGNIIDRAIPEYIIKDVEGIMDSQFERVPNNIHHGVVDYWKMGNSIINLFDVYIVSGVGFIIFNMVLSLILKWTKEAKKEKMKNGHDNLEQLAEETDTKIIEVNNDQFDWEKYITEIDKKNEIDKNQHKKKDEPNIDSSDEKKEL